MAEQIREPLVILRRKQVEARTGLPCSSLYRQIAAGSFPRPISLGENTVGWLEHEVDAWISGKVEETQRHAGAQSARTEGAQGSYRHRSSVAEATKKGGASC